MTSKKAIVSTTSTELINDGNGRGTIFIMASSTSVTYRLWQVKHHAATLEAHKSSRNQLF